MKDRIVQLQELATVLEPSADDRYLLRDKVIEYAEDFLDALPKSRAYVATDDQGAGLLESPITDKPIDIGEILHLLRVNVDRPGVNLGTAGYLAFIPLSSLYASALGDYLAEITNMYAGLFYASPGAVRMERMLLRWMADLVGYPEYAAGDLTSGGSIANLSAVVTAREAHDLKAKDYSRSVVYLSDQTHHSIEKALHIAGLKECIRRYIPLDGKYRMRADALDRAISDDKRAGFLPWLIAATAGTTDTGAIDPLGQIADIAGANGMWLHVDGAYGAMFALCQPGRDLLRGIEQSDSIALDPHKGLFLPLGTGAMLVREGQHLRKAHQYQASYLQDKDILAPPDEVSPADLSPELSRPFRGLRLWLPLKLIGVAPFRAALEEKLLLARYFYDEIRRVDRFEVGPPPDLSIVVFRYVPRRGDPNSFNRKLMSSIQQDGRIFLSSTTINGEFALRLAILSFRTHLDTIDLVLDILEKKARDLERNSQ